MSTNLGVTGGHRMSTNLGVTGGHRKSTNLGVTGGHRTAVTSNMLSGTFSSSAMFCLLHFREEFFCVTTLNREDLHGILNFRLFHSCL